MPRPTISIIIPAHNEANYLPATLGSVITQTLQPLEVIVVCNGCTDNTAAYTRQTLPAATTIELPEANVSKARNEGARRARGASFSFWMPTQHFRLQLLRLWLTP